MRLAKIGIKNYKGITELDFQMPQADLSRSGSADFITLVGQNNTGKSSVLEALRFAFPETGLTKPTKDHFRQHSVQSGAIEVDLTFDSLTDRERTRPGVRHHVHDDKYRIMKRWDTPNMVRPITEAYARPRTLVDPEFLQKATRASILQRGDPWAAALAGFEALNGPLPEKKLIKKDQDSLTQFILENHLDLTQLGEPGWSPNPGGIAANPDSAMPRLIFVPAVCEVADEADPSKAGSAAQEIMRLLFERTLDRHATITAFKAAAAAVQELFDNVTGEPTVLSLQNQISERFRRLIDLSVRLGFTPPDVAKDLTKATTIKVVDRELVTDPAHQGHGAQRALILTLLELYAEQTRQMLDEGVEEAAIDRGVLILVEEPEIYLHPQMCRRMRNVLVNIARSGSGQVICSSHSPVFLDLADRHDGIVLFRKDEDGACTYLQRSEDLFPGGTGAEMRKRLRMLLDFDPAVCEVFFSNNVCLVEGDCEIAALWSTVRHLAEQGVLDLEKALRRLHSTTLVNCKGKWTIPAIQTVLNGFSIPYRIVHDVDEDTAEPANIRILELLGNDESRRHLHAPNFEQAIWKEAWSSDKPWRAAKKVRAGDVPQELKTFVEFLFGCTLSSLQP